MGVSAHLQDSTALPMVRHSAGLVTVEKRKPRFASSSSYPILILSERFRVLPLLQSTHMVSFVLLWMIAEDESSSVNSVHNPHSVYTVNSEKDTSF